MAEETKTAQTTAQPAPSKPAPAPAPAQTAKAAPVSKNVKLVLMKAGSFSGFGFRHIQKGQEITVDNAKADKLIATGLFKKI